MFRKNSNIPPFLQKNHPLCHPEQSFHLQNAIQENPVNFRLNNIIVYGQSPREIDENLAMIAYGVGYVKIHSTTAMFRSDLKEIVKVCEKHDVTPFIGGGILEDRKNSGDWYQLTKFLHKIGIRTVEISNGSGSLNTKEYKEKIKKYSSDFDNVLAEIGPKNNTTDIDKWHAELDVALESNVSDIVLEGCGSGKAGIYHNSTVPKILLVLSLVDKLNYDLRKVIIEAPELIQQQYWIQYGFGWNTRLGNLSLDADTQHRISSYRINATAPEITSNISEAKEVLRKCLKDLFDFCAKEGVNPNSIIDLCDGEGFVFNTPENVEAYFKYLLKNIKNDNNSFGPKIISINLSDFFNNRVG